MRQFLTILCLTLIGFVLLILVVDVIENMDKFIDNKVPISIVVNYYLNSLPWYVNIGLPMSMLISSVFSVGTIAQRNELIAMKSSGISLYRIALPILIVAFFISILSFQFDNGIVSRGHEKRFNIEKEYMTSRSKKRKKSVMHNIFLQKKERVHIAIEKYQVNLYKAEGVSFFVLEDAIVRTRIDAKSMTWNDSSHTWNIASYSLREFDGSGQEKSVVISKQDTTIFLDVTPQDILQKSKSTEEMNFDELSTRIEKLNENGVNTRRWEVDRNFKVSFAFTNLIIVLFGIPLVTMRPKGGLTFGAGMGILVIFVYYAFIKFGLSLGYKGMMNPLTAAWLGNIVFCAGGIGLLLLVRK
ncbi:MAG: YjgP/YjgQ family permease [Candidatus Marinimicrobia bacterium]|nr:YjgP/YjgQ family permease [Candidatus Neomarinimicrobiota bacterium]